MRPVLVIVGNILVYQAFQMLSIENDYMIEQIPPAATNPALSDAILPRTLKTGAHRLDTEAINGADDFLVKVGGSIEDRIFWRGIVGNASRNC
jgi:hypothetical protein